MVQGSGSVLWSQAFGGWQKKVPHRGIGGVLLRELGALESDSKPSSLSQALWDVMGLLWATRSPSAKWAYSTS